MIVRSIAGLFFKHLIKTTGGKNQIFSDVDHGDIICLMPFKMSAGGLKPARDGQVKTSQFLQKNTVFFSLVKTFDLLILQAITFSSNRDDFCMLQKSIKNSPGRWNITNKFTPVFNRSIAGHYC